VSAQPWCDPLFETQSATHWFLQHLVVRPILFLQHLKFYQNPADYMEARAGNSILEFETLFSDIQKLLNGSGLTAVAKMYSMGLSHHPFTLLKSEMSSSNVKHQ